MASLLTVPMAKASPHLKRHEVFSTCLFVLLVTTKFCLKSNGTAFLVILQIFGLL